MQTTPEAAVDENAGPTAPHQKQSYLKANVATVLAIAIAATATWITAMSLVEAHGIGPTHFGQATEVGKRAYSGAFLLALDGVALVFVAGLARLAFRGFRSGR